jgi:uncharacterized protein YjbJ (UPF0337 family)
LRFTYKESGRWRVHEVKGSVKEDDGKLSDNPKLEAEGTVDKIVGRVQGKIGQINNGFW